MPKKPKPAPTYQHLGPNGVVGRISRADAAEKMYGTGSTQHLKAIALDAPPKSTPAQIKLLSLEAQARGQIPFLKDVDAIRKAVALGDGSAVAKVRALKPGNIDKPALAAVHAAHEVGAADALRLLVANGTTKKPKTITKYREAAANKGPRDSTINQVVGLDSKVAEAIADAKRLALVDDGDVDSIVAKIFGAANSVNAALTSSINGAGNEGSSDVAGLANVAMVWQAEADACVDCLAYSGQVCQPGDDWPIGLTFDDSSPYDASLPDGPPLHPNCRCTVEPLGDPSYADALQREAQRSVLRGFSLPSESMATRIRAAKNVLGNGPDAPKSVISYSQRAIGNGKFPTRGRP